MTYHVTAESHPELTEGQREKVNERVSKWRKRRWEPRASNRAFGMPLYGHTRGELANALDRIVAEMTV